MPASTHSFTAFRWGHKWVVLAVLIRFPFSRRCWALPLLVALYHAKESGRNRVVSWNQIGAARSRKAG